MKRSYTSTSTRICLLSLVLLIGIFLNGCGRSASHRGESLDPGHPEVGSNIQMTTVGDERQASSVREQASAQDQLTEQKERPSAEVKWRPIDQDAEDASSKSESALEVDTEMIEVPDRGSEHKLPTAPIAEADDDELDGRSTAADATAPKTAPHSERLEWDGDHTLTFGELYESVGVRGIVLSDKLEALNGKEVEMNGYMAPPLTAGVRFFVLTKSLMAVCPFCSTDADWPTDIVVVYLPDGDQLNPTQHPVKVTGKLDTGSYTDEDTGFVSLVRIYAEKVEVLK